MMSHDSDSEYYLDPDSNLDSDGVLYSEVPNESKIAGDNVKSDLGTITDVDHLDKLVVQQKTSVEKDHSSKIAEIGRHDFSRLIRQQKLLTWMQKLFLKRMNKLAY